MVPEAYRALPLDAKIVYVTRYGEHIWSQRLRYFKGAQTAAVDLQNNPLEDWEFDKSGDLVKYKGKSMSDLRSGNYPEGVDGNEFQQDWNHMQEEIERLQDMEDVERERAANAKPPTTP